MRIALLGSLQVNDGRTTLGPRDRVILQALATRPGAELSAEALAETLWGEDLPETWQKVVQGCIVRLRKALGAEAIQTSPHGYRLDLHKDEVDHLQFEHLLTRARELLANGEAERALYVTGQARELWRGEPLVDLADWGPGRIEAERLVELWRDAEDLHAEAGLRAGRYQDVLGDALRMVAEQPTRERRWGLLALAQYQVGRQGDALQTLQRAKTTLVDELGLDPGPELAQLEQAILRQDPSLASRTVLPPTSAECPYLGLVAYDISDAPAFFGREADITACLRRLDEANVLAVVGPSGCGKSSLARAGVAATLERDGRRVRVCAPGPHPTDALSFANPRATDVLVVDQCEEALAPDLDPTERAEFFDQLVAFAVAGRGVLVISIRADRLGELSTHPAFARLVERGLYLLGAMTAPDLRLAIEGPAAQAGLRLEPGLVDLLVREVEGEPAALPLLSHVLRQTWKGREGNTLTVACYSATGGIREAISQSAEGLFRELTPGQQGVLRDLMVRLVAADDVGEPVRQRVLRRSVATDEDHSLLIERLVGARLLSSDGETVEIAHEALAMAWPRLRSWLDDDVDGLRIMRHLTVAATSWDDLGRPDSELYRGVRQARAVEWRERAAPSLTFAERDFLAASAALAETEQRATEEQVRREHRSNQRLRLGLAAVAVLLAVAIVAGALAKTAADRADQQALVADARRLGSEALRADDLDRSLLLAAAGMRLDGSVDTRNNLLATLDRAPHLIRSVRTSSKIRSLTVSSQTGQVAVALGDDNPATGALHDGTTLKQVGRVPAARAASLVASPDGRLLAAALKSEITGGPSETPALLLLDQTGNIAPTQLGGIPPKRFVAQEMAFSPNGRWLALGLGHTEDAEPQVVGVWDLMAPQRPIAVVDVGGSRSPTVSADGRTLYTIVDGHVQINDLPSGKQRRLLSPDQLKVREIGETLVLSPDGRTLAIAAGAEAVLVDTRSLATQMLLRVQGRIDDLAFSRDGRRVASAGEELSVWDVSGKEPAELLHQETGGSQLVAFSPDGRTLYSAGSSGLLLLAWDLTGDRSFLTEHPGGAIAAAGPPVLRFSPDARKVGYVWGFPPALQVREVTTGKLGPVIKVDTPQRNWTDMAWSPDSRMLNATTGDSRVGIWDATTGRKLAEHTLEQGSGRSREATAEGASIAFWSRDGKYLLVGSTTGRLHVLDGRSLRQVREPIRVTASAPGAEPDPLGWFEPSSDLHTVVGSGGEVVDYLSGDVEAPFEIAGPNPLLSYSPDGERIFVGTSEGDVGLLDAATMDWISRPVAARPFPGYIIAWSEDSSRVATFSDGRVGWWDGRTGAFQGAATVGGEGFGAVAFSQDGKTLNIAGDSGSVRSWDLRPGSWIEAACRMAGRPLTKVEWDTYLPQRDFEPICPT
ncbi:MAG: BTAD domain-containing putative transcriptional regulator [Pedococcus sp.]